MDIVASSEDASLDFSIEFSNLPSSRAGDVCWRLIFRMEYGKDVGMVGEICFCPCLFCFCLLGNEKIFPSRRLDCVWRSSLKIGILTFHSQLNYGGVLQCWALAQALRGLGHEVVVVDRWMAPDNNRLMGPFCKHDLRMCLGIVMRGLVGCGQIGVAVRYWRTMRFVRSIGLTNYHFYDWKDAPEDLGVDCLVVGSDQLWHGGDWGYPDPRPYLLEGAPKVPAIAYAVSFGMKKLLPEYDYVSGFKRFEMISMREREAVEMVESCGVPAVQTVDPTQLIERSIVARLVGRRKKKKQIACYFLAQPIGECLKTLEEYACANQCKVKILCHEMHYIRKVPRTLREMFQRLRDFLFRKRTVVCLGYGPKEFVRVIAESEACITDSFHAVMFSTVFDVNCRFLRPSTEGRAMMFSRIEEFVKDVVQGPMIADSLTLALKSLKSGEHVVYSHDCLSLLRAKSLKWLSGAIEKAVAK